jgi:hypothetical protein
MVCHAQHATDPAIHGQEGNRALPWTYNRMQPGAGRSVPKPTSALNVLRGVRRVQISLGYDPPALASLNLSLKGLVHEVIIVHGPEVLEIKRTLPIPFPAVRPLACDEVYWT